MSAIPWSQLALPDSPVLAPKQVCLTPRQLQVLSRLTEGDSYKEIAQRLGISVQTVNDHIKDVYRKLNVHCRAHAIRCCHNGIPSGEKEEMDARAPLH